MRRGRAGRLPAPGPRWPARCRRWRPGRRTRRPARRASRRGRPGGGRHAAGGKARGTYESTCHESRSGQSLRTAAGPCLRWSGVVGAPRRLSRSMGPSPSLRARGQSSMRASRQARPPAAAARLQFRRRWRAAPRSTGRTVPQSIYKVFAMASRARPQGLLAWLPEQDVKRPMRRACAAKAFQRDYGVLGASRAPIPARAQAGAHRFATVPVRCAGGTRAPSSRW